MATKGVIARNRQEIVTMVPEEAMAKVPGVRVESIEPYSADVVAMLKAIDTDGFEGTYARGLAIAHHQVSRKHARIFVVRSDVAKAFGGERVFINPEYEPVGDETEEFREACLSHPFRDTRKITRPTKVLARFLNVKMEPMQVELSGMAAKVFQHETDHTLGKSIWQDKVA